MRLRTQVVLTSISKSLKHVSVFILAIFLTRLISPHDYGSYLQVMVITNTVIYLSIFGIPSSVYYFLPRSAEKRRMMRNTISLLLMVSVGVSACLYFATDLIASRFNNPDLLQFGWLIGAFVLLQIPIKLFEPFMVATKNVPRFVAINASFNIGFLAAVLIPILLGMNLYEVLVVLFGFYLLQMSVIYIAIVITYRQLQDDAEGEAYRVKEQVAYSAPIGFSGAIAQVGVAIDKIIVSSYYDPAMLAVYARGAMEIPMLNVVANSLGNILMPKFVEQYHKGNKAEVLRLWHSSIRMMAMFIYPTLVFFILTAGHLIPFLFTEEYIGSVIIFQVYTLGLVTRITSYDAIVRAVGKTGILFKMTMLSVVLNITLTIGLIELIGIVGAPLATVLVGTSLRFIYLIIITRLLDISLAQVFPWMTLLKLLAISGIAALAILPVLALDLSHFLMLVCCGLVFAPVYLIGFRFSGALNPTERKSVSGLLPKKLRWII